MISPVGNGRGSPLRVAIATGIDNVLGIETVVRIVRSIDVNSQ